MKIGKNICKLSAVLLLALYMPTITQAQLLKKIKDKVNQTIDNKTNKTIDNTVNSADKKVDNTVNSAIGKNGSNSSTPSNTNTSTNTASSPTPASGPKIGAYKNYDFVPGDKIIFEDHFDTDEEGEFPAHWHLAQGQGTMNTFDNRKVFLLTDRSTKATPAIKTKAYLTDSFTVEFDTYSKDDYGPALGFYNSEGDVHGDYTELVSIVMNDRHGNIRVTPKDNKNETVLQYPPALASDNYLNKWHHIAIAYKNKRLKIYVDEYRVASIPEIDLKANVISIRGDGQPEKPVMITNFKLAQGAGIKTQETKFTDTKIVTHGINFDINKADIRPESMGTINTIVGILKNNPDLKFEIQGHTDNSGVAANNLTLSQKRADAVKKQMVALGIDESRLTTKGFGDTKPLSDNGTPEGKANNRRVEFVKL
ncbi:MAG: OmpA family protein [Bacteroidetes bacterium]|nr:OmpA family protein [Bacteroidota bacterium]